jgi:hypothetical protein
MAKATLDPQRYVAAIARSGKTIYDPIEIGDEELWIPSPELEKLLDKGLRHLSLAGLPLRTRSKVVKQHVCRILGYPTPRKFTKTKPRFPGQLFDTYTQKANNLQVWNEELSAVRRYVLIRVSGADIITRVKVVTGDILSLLDTTGTLTQKYQARCIPNTAAELVSRKDTALVQPFVSAKIALDKIAPITYPASGQLLPIVSVFERLRRLVGSHFVDAGSDQERNRGAALHRLSCMALGYASYQDDGQFPDIKHQLVEIKLQTSPTIDLGLVCPNSVEPLDVPQVQRTQIRHCDVRYAVFYGQINNQKVTLTHFMLVTGVDFFQRFPQFGGKILNKKLQIPLPGDFFET